MLWVDDKLAIDESEFTVTGIRSQGAGGQNVNKVATAVQLRFDIAASSLPDDVKTRLLRQSDHRLTKDGVLVIKSQESRSRERNYQIALERLATFIREGNKVRKKRIPTRPSLAAKRRRLAQKNRRSEIKSNRNKPNV